MKEPESAADPRPGGEPFFIDNECPKCGTELVLADKLPDEEIEEAKVWHDEWACPDDSCDKNGVFLDVPEAFWERLYSRKEDTVSLEDL